MQFGKLNGCWAAAVSYLKCVRPFMINDHVRVTGKLAISRHMTYFYMNKWKTYIEFIIFVNTDVWLADRTYYNCFIWMRIWLFENLSLCHAFKTLVFFCFDFIKFVRIKLKFAKPFTITFTVFRENSTALSSYNVPLSAVFFLVLENFSDSMSDVKDLYWSNFYLSSYMALSKTMKNIKRCFENLAQIKEKVKFLRRKVKLAYIKFPISYFTF